MSARCADEARKAQEKKSTENGEKTIARRKVGMWKKSKMEKLLTMQSELCIS